MRLAQLGHNALHGLAEERAKPDDAVGRGRSGNFVALRTELFRDDVGYLFHPQRLGADDVALANGLWFGHGLVRRGGRPALLTVIHSEIKQQFTSTNNN